ncbi:helix-turn-helix domain-containing protein [Lysinibacillus sp. BW-2-10]|uniref:helix-turn-helix domain-containing protein n=1 Tax=Lysinibacillus sp. BW-2-10 TaxID=2590030 RepID=UPI00117F1B95|nr:helix-turn-helix domain-containing protein [Lysinibacillus sp. BW-2-10]TSI07324.1 transposase [Lysinibacillus sp. BW-2-10]
MAKYSDEFKLKIVTEYLNGKLGFKRLAEKYNIPNCSVIPGWVRAYKEFGIEGIRRKTKKAVYSVQFKLTVLNFMKQTGASYQDTAIEFNLNNQSMIMNWNRKLLEKGVEGLEDKSKGRPPMSKKSKLTTTNHNNIQSREDQLARENELLRLEIAYLKKLNAFQENPNALLKSTSSVGIRTQKRGIPIKRRIEASRYSRSDVSLSDQSNERGRFGSRMGRVDF